MILGISVAVMVVPVLLYSCVNAKVSEVSGKENQGFLSKMGTWTM